MINQHRKTYIVKQDHTRKREGESENGEVTREVVTS